MKKRENKFETFEDLFEAATLYETIEKPVSEWHKSAMKSSYNLNFNLWLQENKGWEYGNEKQYIENLTKQNWVEFLKYEAQQTKEIKKAFQDEKQTWKTENNDTPFWLNSLFDEEAQQTHQYKIFKRQIENNGSFIVKFDNEIINVYTPELALIFTSKELPARQRDTKKQTTVNGTNYLDTFIKAYKKGEQDFEKEFAISPNILYGANASQYVRDIHFNYFHSKYTKARKGWQFVKKQYPIILTHKAIDEHGYFSGIVSKVDEMIKKYPKLFQTFDKCEHQLQPNQKPKAPVIALFCSWVNFAKVLPKEENESVENYCKKVCEKFNLSYSDRIRQNFNGNETKQNKLRVKELILPSIDKETNEKIIQYLTSKEQAKQKIYG